MGVTCKAQAEKEIDRFTKQFDPESQVDSIREYLETLKEEKPEEDYIIRQLVALYKHFGHLDQAITELDGLGDLLLEQGRKQEAVQVIQEIITLSPANIDDYKKLLEQLQP